MRTIAQRQPLREFWGSAPKRLSGGCQCILWFRWIERREVKHLFWQEVAAVHCKVAASQEEQMLLLTILVLSWPWEDGRISAYKIFSWKSLTTWRPALSVVSRAHSASFSPWTPWRGWWRSKTAVASDFILAVPHDERHFLVANYKALAFCVLCTSVWF